MIGPAFLALLNRSRDVTSVVNGRIHFGARAQDSGLPAIVLTTVTRTMPRTFDGESDYELGTIQVDVLANDYATAKRLAESVREALDGFTGSADSSSTVIDRLEIEDERDIASEQQVGRSTPVFGVSLDADYQSHER